MTGRLTHIDEHGDARMVDVGDKAVIPARGVAEVVSIGEQDIGG